MAKPTTNAKFDQHLKKVRRARTQTNEVMSSLNLAQKSAGKTLKVAWEVTFDLFCKSRAELDENKLTRLSGVIYKLAQSHGQVLSSEHKSRDLTEQLTAFVELAERAGMPSETCRKLEQDLNLM